MRRNDAKRRTINPDDETKRTEKDYRQRKEDIDRKTRSGMDNISRDRSDRYSQGSHRAKDVGDSKRFRGRQDD